ncbi:MAG: NAD(P)H-quinone oxidoreductase [Legionella sp.]|uniref:NAD(P)H-quinone oxidoreductase n=1 Tax=Legionella sp. TaxID=459 RepID=UPI0039E68691
MYFVLIKNPGSHSRLILEEGPTPEYKENQLLVRVKATALNRADLMQRYGKYPPPHGECDIPGLELAGEVVAVGSQVTQFKAGDRVYGLVGSGAHAEYCIVDAALAHHIPKSWDYDFAAALPESLVTVYASIFHLGELRAGQTLLIHGAGSGIASLAIPMAKQAGAKVITTVGSDIKIEKAFALGADQVINHRTHDFEDLIPEQSIDLILDFIGGDYFNKHLHLLRLKSKLIQIACLNGSTVECNLALLMRKRLQIIGFVLRSQTIEEKACLWKAAHEQWFPLLEQKKIMPIIDSEFPLAEIETAQQYMQSGKHFGKIVLHVD